MLGGEGVTVEVEETLLGRWKLNVGRPLIATSTPLTSENAGAGAEEEKDNVTAAEMVEDPSEREFRIKFNPLKNNMNLLTWFDEAIADVLNRIK
ncbi:hypothetical protein J437_LFUL018761 [Ladona fulva]|uniref:Uncharacterized protein n=1 Tax=Ladona fulva TaxID=123851 RepID=A0A8K0KPN5_LADFU|nr:hypothetical protein J437_LFUL018761 [Ladona fulva]